MVTRNVTDQHEERSSVKTGPTIHARVGAPVPAGSLSDPVELLTGQRTWRMEDGIAAHIGMTVFNYYDRVECTVESDAGEGWFTVVQKNGQRKTLNGQRTCSVETAALKGWL